MEHDELDESEYNDYTLFPLCDTLSNLYFALLNASSYHDKKEYQTFDIKEKQDSEINRLKARVVFSEFDITGYDYKGRFTKFEPPLNSSVHLNDKLEKIIRFLNSMDKQTESLETRIITCKYRTPIVHQFEVTSRITRKWVFPVGRICII